MEESFPYELNKVLMSLLFMFTVCCICLWDVWRGVREQSALVRVCIETTSLNASDSTRKKNSFYSFKMASATTNISFCALMG